MSPSRFGHARIARALGRTLVLAVLLATVADAPAAVANGPSVIVKVHQASGLVSPYFQLSAAPGGRVRAGGLELVNPTSGRITVRLDPVDAITTSTLGSAYALSNAGMHGATTWLRLSRAQVTLAPHASQSVSVSLAVPVSATPGDYLAGVSVEALGQTQPATLTRGLAIGEIDRYAIGVEVRVPGPRHPAVYFTGASIAREPAGLAFLLSASNTGNVILKGVHGWVRVSAGNRAVATTTIAPGTFVSGTSISYPLPARREQPAPGARYRVRAVLYYAGGVARLDTIVQFSHAAAVTQQNYGGRRLPQARSPWRWILLALLAVALLAAAGWLLARRRQPLSRSTGLKRLDRALASPADLPVSIIVVSAERRVMGAIATAMAPRLRRADRICDLGKEGLLIICPATSRAAATALRRDLNEHLARDRDLADRPVEMIVSTAVKPTTTTTLLARVKATRRREGQAMADSGEPSATAAEPR